MDYGKTAKEILDKVGGSKNIVSAAHCATRLRLVIADNSKADKGALENIEGVKGVFEASGQLQIILGQGQSIRYLTSLLLSQVLRPAQRQRQRRLQPNSRMCL